MHLWSPCADRLRPIGGLRSPELMNTVCDSRAGRGPCILMRTVNKDTDFARLPSLLAKSPTRVMVTLDNELEGHAATTRSGNLKLGSSPSGRQWDDGPPREDYQEVSPTTLRTVHQWSRPWLPEDEAPGVNGQPIQSSRAHSSATLHTMQRRWSADRACRSAPESRRPE